MTKLEKFIQKKEKQADTLIIIGEKGISDIYVGYKMALGDVKNFLLKEGAKMTDWHKEFNDTFIIDDYGAGTMAKYKAIKEFIERLIKSQREEAVRGFVRLFHESARTMIDPTFTDKYCEYDDTDDWYCNYHRYIDDLLDQFIADENKDETTEDKWRTQGYVEGGTNEKA